MSDEKLRALTVYLPPAEVAALEAEATAEGRSGASAQIRFILSRRRQQLAAAEGD